jgi:chemotaxis signal transduction protein
MEGIVEQDIMEDTLGDRFLIFQLDNEVYGIDLEFVTEIIGKFHF